MVKVCLLAFVLLILFCTINSVRSASNQYLGAKDCKAEANWALMLRRDLNAGGAVNVMPKDQPVLDIVLAHKGTTDELWHKVYGNCAGVRT